MSEVKVSRERRARTVLMDLAKLSPPLVVRNIRPGDRFRPLGMTGSRKVADYLIDRKVGRVYRDEIPLVCDKKGIIWLVGFEIADRVKVDRSTKEVLKVEVVRRRGKAVAAV
jgi:tRNA(Ile)-lysidine synthase